MKKNSSKISELTKEIMKEKGITDVANLQSLLKEILKMEQKLYSMQNLMKNLVMKDMTTAKRKQTIETESQKRL